MPLKIFHSGRQSQLERSKVEKAIEELYEAVDSMDITVLDGQQIAKLAVRVYDLEIDGQDAGSSNSKQLSFFAPLSQELYKRYPLGEKEERTFHNSLHNFFKIPPGKSSAINLADDLTTQFAWFVDGHDRPDIPINGSCFKPTLGGLSGWGFQEGPFDFETDKDNDDYVFDDLVTEPPCLRAFFLDRYPGYEEEEISHFMFGLKIDCENGHELFKGEVLQILMAMKGQLKLRELEKHVVFPLLVFSFMGRQGRIIEAFHDGSYLNIHKSRLFEFRNFEEAPFDLFARYFANTPIGDTRHLPVPQQIHTEATSAVDSTMKLHDSGTVRQQRLTKQGENTLERRPSLRNFWKQRLSVRSKKDNRRGDVRTTFPDQVEE